MEQFALCSTTVAKIEEKTCAIKTALKSLSEEEYLQIVALLLEPIEALDACEDVQNDDETILVELDKDLQFCPLTGEFYTIHPIRRVDIADFVQYRSTNIYRVLRTLDQFSNLIRLCL